MEEDKKMWDNDKIQYLTHAGVIFIVYLFVSILFFYMISPFTEGFFNTFNQLEAGHATDEIQYFGPLLHTAVRIILALGLAIPVVWFIFWVFSREPSRHRRRYF